jgi:diadenosine tetraphosphate (Ap4A) HIT family hydrolase
MSHIHGIRCPLCDEAGGELVWQDARLRVIVAHEPDYPGFCRVIWRDHVAEMSDLAAEDAEHVMRTVLRVERVLREVMAPAKINLAALGNQVPHLHWHVIPRYADDAHFPSPVWAPKRRTVPEALFAQRLELAARLPDALRAALGAA